MRIVVGLLFVFATTSAHAQAPRIDRIEIVEKGIYKAEVEKKQDAARTVTGTVSVLTDIKNISKTTRIPARVGTRFGIRYRIVGSPKGAKVVLTMITRLPKQGLRNPKTGDTHYRSEYTAEKIIGDENYRDYGFDADWEAVPGTWIFEIRYQGKTLAEQRFEVVKP